MHTADRFALESSTQYKTIDDTVRPYCIIYDKTFDCCGYIILQYPLTQVRSKENLLRSNNYKKMADKGPCGRGKLAFYREIDL